MPCEFPAYNGADLVVGVVLVYVLLPWQTGGPDVRVGGVVHWGLQLQRRDVVLDIALVLDVQQVLVARMEAVGGYLRFGDECISLVSKFPVMFPESDFYLSGLVVIKTMGGSQHKSERQRKSCFNDPA